jgi:hypothetical protein
MFPKANAEFPELGSVEVRAVFNSSVFSNLIAAWNVQTNPIMLLVITPFAKARGCAQAIQEVTSEETHVVATSSQALAQLRAREYVAVLIDHAFLETEPVESDMVLEHIGTAVPVHVNFAINGMERVVRELRAALHRHKKQVLRMRQEVQQALRNELKDTITALLLSCEMALQVPDLHSAAEGRMRTVHALAHEMRLKLEGVA